MRLLENEEGGELEAAKNCPHRARESDDRCRVGDEEGRRKDVERGSLLSILRKCVNCLRDGDGSVWKTAGRPERWAVDLDLRARLIAAHEPFDKPKPVFLDGLVDVYTAGP